MGMTITKNGTEYYIELLNSGDIAVLNFDTGRILQFSTEEYNAWMRS